MPLHKKGFYMTDREIEEAHQIIKGYHEKYFALSEYITKGAKLQFKFIL
ncbi:MAG: hypothetical protein HY026_01505 [Deltaproteobacteria bacterium]|nr:hypothetical protein [Deltaproteobacteria bacterium]